MPVCRDGKQPTRFGGPFDRQVETSTVIQHAAVKGIPCRITTYQCTSVSPTLLIVTVFYHILHKT